MEASAGEEARDVDCWSCSAFFLARRAARAALTVYGVTLD